MSSRAGVRVATIVVTSTMVALLAATGGAEASASAQVACLPSAASAVRYYTRPRNCVFTVRGKQPAGYTMVNASGLHWHGWGGAHPRSTGTLRANMGFHTRARVTLSKRSTCHGRVRYGRATFVRTATGERSSIALDTCTDGAAEG